MVTNTMIPMASSPTILPQPPPDCPAKSSIFVDRDYNSLHTPEIPQFVTTNARLPASVSPLLERLNACLKDAYDPLNKRNIFDNVIRLLTLNILPISTHSLRCMQQMDTVVNDINAELAVTGYRLINPGNTALLHLEFELIK